MAPCSARRPAASSRSAPWRLPCRRLRRLPHEEALAAVAATVLRPASDDVIHDRRGLGRGDLQVGLA